MGQALPHAGLFLTNSTPLSFDGRLENHYSLVTRHIHTATASSMAHNNDFQGPWSTAWQTKGGTRGKLCFSISNFSIFHWVEPVLWIVFFFFFNDLIFLILSSLLVCLCSLVDLLESWTMDHYWSTSPGIQTNQWQPVCLLSSFVLVL